MCDGPLRLYCAVDFLLNVHNAEGALDVKAMNGNVLANDGNSLPLTVAYGTALRVKPQATLPGYSAREVIHGHCLSGHHAECCVFQIEIVLRSVNGSRLSVHCHCGYSTVGLFCSRERALVITVFLAAAIVGNEVCGKFHVSAQH